MPAGAFWQIQYSDDIDHRIQARSDRQRFAQDRNVLTATTRHHEGHFLLEVQLIDDALTTFDDSLRRLYERQDYEQETSRRSIFEVQYMGRFPDPPDLPDPPREVDPQIRNRIISEYLGGSEGRRRLAEFNDCPTSNAEGLLVGREESLHG